MSELINRKFKCIGCGETRPCYLETNQSKDEIAFYDAAEDLKCVLDKTNQTAYNWIEVLANEANKQPDTNQLNISQQRELLTDYHEFYLKWRMTVSDSNVKYAVDAFINKK